MLLSKKILLIDIVIYANKKDIKSNPKNTLRVKKEWPRTERIEIKMGGQGWCSVDADENKILIITIQAAKY